LAAREVEKGCLVFGKEGEVALLAGRERCVGFGDGGEEWFVVGEECEWSAVEVKAEVADGGVGGEELFVEGGVAGFRGGKFAGEESEGLPGPVEALLEYGADVGVGGVRGKGDGGGGVWVVKWNGGG
jgi:hypothetical protein